MGVCGYVYLHVCECVSVCLKVCLTCVLPACLRAWLYLVHIAWHNVVEQSPSALVPSAIQHAAIQTDHRVGLVVKASASRAEDPGFESRLRSSHTSDIKIGTPLVTLLGAWRFRVSAETGRPDVSKPWLGEVESLICSFYLSVTACKTVRADPSLRHTSMLLGR